MYGPAPVASVDVGSPAERAGVRAGDHIFEIDGEPMRDMIDYYVAVADDVPHRFLLERGGNRIEVEVEPGGPGPGIQVAEPVFGRLMLCDNKCTFCFVDQLPAGLRGPVYVKDDDYRLSFLQGNFITLTNLGAGDLERILEDRLSPLYVSLHATDPELRREIFRSRGAKRALTNLAALIEGGIEVHVQLVLMRGVNDAGQLERTLEDLAGPYRGTASIGVVPVGISRGGRVEAPERWGFGRESSLQVIETLERWRGEFGQAGPFAADEFFYMAGIAAAGRGLLRLFSADRERHRARQDLQRLVRGEFLATLLAGRGL